MEVFIWSGVLILSLIALIKGADKFTQGAEAAGVKLGIPQFIVGVTIVSIGTSLPELASSVAATMKGSSEIVIANVIGSNVANILLVLGLGAVIAGVSSKRNIAKEDIPILLLTSGLLALAALDGVVSLFEGIIALLLFGAYLWRIFKHKEQVEVEAEESWAFLKLAVGLVLVVGGAIYLVDSIVALATIIGLSTAAISASIVAFGTSVPEAAVTIAAVLRKNGEIALGNIVGSNIFNILLIPGVAALIAPLAFETSMLTIGLPAMILSTGLLWYALQDQTITRREGMVFLASYLLFIILVLRIP